MGSVILLYCLKKNLNASRPSEHALVGPIYRKVRCKQTAFFAHLISIVLIARTRSAGDGKRKRKKSAPSKSIHESFLVRVEDRRQNEFVYLYRYYCCRIVWISNCDTFDDQTTPPPVDAYGFLVACTRRPSGLVGNLHTC